MMRLCLQSGSMLVALALVLGCSQQEPIEAGGVAIVDLDEVARQLGRDVEMAEAIESAKSSINGQLEVFQQSLNEQYQAQVGALSEQPGQPANQQQQQLANVARELNSQLQQAAQGAENQLKKYRLQLVSRFRDEARPIAEAVAEERGLSIVMTRDEVHMLSYSGAVDITDEVSTKMAASAESSPSKVAQVSYEEPATTQR